MEISPDYEVEKRHFDSNKLLLSIAPFEIVVTCIIYIQQVIIVAKRNAIGVRVTSYLTIVKDI